MISIGRKGWGLLPDAMTDLGQALKSFRRGLADETDEDRSKAKRSNG